MVLMVRTNSRYSITIVLYQVYSHNRVRGLISAPVISKGSIGRLI